MKNKFEKSKSNRERTEYTAILLFCVQYALATYDLRGRQMILFL